MIDVTVGENQMPNIGRVVTTVPHSCEYFVSFIRPSRINQEVPITRLQQEARLTEKSSLETKTGLLDSIVEFHGPNGAMAAQASSRLGSFAESLNVHLAPFGCACNFTLNPFEIRVMSSKDNHCGAVLEAALGV